MTVDDGPRSWALLEDGGCASLRVSARGRRYLSEPACPYAPFTSALRIEEPGVRFNDRDVRYETCDGDCAGLPADVTMSAPVVWGVVAPAVGFVCVDTASGPFVARASSDGLVLAPVPANADRQPDEPLPFLPDGRFAGWEGPGQEAKIEACRAAGAPGGQPLVSKSWPLRIELPRDLEDRDPALTITTDTGYAPEGGALNVIEQGYRIPLRLHQDTKAIAVTLDGDGGPVSTELPLPARIIDALTGVMRCGWPPTIVIRLDGDLTPHLLLGDDAKACP